MTLGKMLHATMAALFTKPATHPYPAEPFPEPAGTRGQIVFDPAKCIGCKICMRDCPADAIRIDKVGEKRFAAEFNLGHCIFCGQCVDSCPRKALFVSNRTELAGFARESLVARFEPPPPDSAPAVVAKP